MHIKRNVLLEEVVGEEVSLHFRIPQGDYSIQGNLTNFRFPWNVTLSHTPQQWDSSDLPDILKNTYQSVSQLDFLGSASILKIETLGEEGKVVYYSDRIPKPYNLRRDNSTHLEKLNRLRREIFGEEYVYPH
jgi:hypothetical protein